MAVRIVADSAAALPPDLAGAHGIGVVPLQVMIDDDSVPDGTLSNHELLARVEAGARVTTSAPPPGAFAAALDEAQEGDGVVVLTVAASMSATYRSALVAAGLHAGETRVVDTETAAGAEALVALHTARVAATGAPIDEVEREAKRAMAAVRLVATVDGLDFLVRSGRVPGLAGKAGDRLGVRPVFEFRDGKARPLFPSFSRSRSLDRIYAAWADTRATGGRLHIAGQHALAHGDARALVDRVVAQVEPASSFIGEFSTVMIAHTGPGVVGLAWWWDA